MSRYLSENFLPFGLCPGPSQPKDLDSFLAPFIQELRLLSQGVPAYDAHTQAPFSLKAHLILISGDTPGVSKLFHLSGHIAKYPCRACKLEGTPYKITFKTKKDQVREKTQYYYPIHAPAPLGPNPQLRHARIDANALPYRTKEQYKADGYASALDGRIATETGVKGVSPFARIKTILYPASCPFDVMHLVFLGFTRDLCTLLNGSYFKTTHLNQHDGSMLEAQWTQLGVDMANIGAPVSGDDTLAILCCT